MSKYDLLDARSELEQVITKDLKRALEKRGCEVQHNGTESSCSGPNIPDIEVYSGNYIFCIEVTKRKKSQQDNEYQSIKDHLIEIKKANNSKKCFCIFISPETYHRTFSSIRDSNVINSNKPDLKIIPINFNNFELFITKLITNHKEKYTIKEIIQLFDKTEEYINDESILKLLFTILFYNDNSLSESIKLKEDNNHQATIQSLISDLKKLEDDLRKQGMAIHTEAIRNVIYLVFIKLYEEKREYEKNLNRFSRIGFLKFQENIGNNKTATHKLFEIIKQDNDLQSAKMFSEHDLLAEKLNDEFVTKYFIEPFEKYFFYTTKIDGLGAAYEVLGQLSGKDTKAGQFFTPENIVRFMVQVAGLRERDVVLDPACGTGRFLIYAMHDMFGKINSTSSKEDERRIKKEQLWGTDYDNYVSKLCKMNMYIHKDGKSNISNIDGHLLPGKDNTIDVILTNPPLGEMSYNLPSYSMDFKLNRMEVIPKRNVTQEKINNLKEIINDETNLTKIRNITNKIIELESKLTLNPEIKIRGSEIKGGALFINSAWHYLKNISRSDRPHEWRGGTLIIIVDEGLLNTDDYFDFRKFLKKHFYIKAIFSLTRDTFIPVSKTQTKTSILYLVKKDDVDVIQQEPVFFAYIDKVGLNTKKKICENHMFNNGHENVLKAFIDFRHNILSSYIQDNFNISRFRQKMQMDMTFGIEDNSYRYLREFAFLQDRIDENFNNPRFDEINKILDRSDSSMPLGDSNIMVSITSGKTPRNMHYIPDGVDGGVRFLGATNILAGNINIESAPRISEDFHNGVLKGSKINKGKLLISMAGTIGRCAIYREEEEVNANQAVAIIELNTNSDILSDYLERYLNSRIGQLFFEKLQHISSQPNINLEEIKTIMIIKPVNQEEIISVFREKDKKIYQLEQKIIDEVEDSKVVFEKMIFP